MMRTNRRKRKKNQLFRRCHIWRPHIRNTIYVCSVAVCSGYKCVVHIVSGWKYGIRHADVGNVWCESFFFTALVNLSTRNAILMFFYMHGMRFPSHTENTVCVCTKSDFMAVVQFMFRLFTVADTGYSVTSPLPLNFILSHTYSLTPKHTTYICFSRLKLYDCLLWCSHYTLCGVAFRFVLLKYICKR